MEMSGQHRIPAVLPVGQNALVIIEYKVGCTQHTVWMFLRTENTLAPSDINVRRHCFSYC